MEKVNKDPEETPGRSVLPEKQETKTRLSTQKVEENPNEEVTEQSKREEEQERTKHFCHRCEQQENDMKASQETYDEIMRRWLTLDEDKIPAEPREALKSQQQLYDTIITDKKKRINDLLQELERRDDHYMKTLRNNEEEIDLLVDRMVEQMRTRTKAYREELGQMETVDQQETEVSLAQYKAEWKQEMKELYDKQTAEMTEWMDKVENDAEKHKDQLLKETDLYIQMLREETESQLEVQRAHQQLKAINRIIKLQAKTITDEPSKPADRKTNPKK
ncbi:dynein regulatory complex protein 1-like isoform X2 [Amphiprion ocellaris]|uniref:dynein regulatory complex protein 1-like isoform X2 n=1 Tax=Amphiprion ocellaris TaxID=80972 RepID=UPI002410CA03|nr:dynein regulatory complex protein 1-like isoform X2 [Amphiprion ocellaris]